ncbi:hypothetical protein TRIUR3_12998 [Triticum urartu]|uniref:Uncharacterized protein n=2 Tax=Triticum TaxID=4564 RepID=A0A9R0TYY1_TRITD|nr:hypothetical protein TRIUR3_12998 [Triticum urartu]VAI22711.1 unnamed protein product [Triticum turgidum subsp. durum]
MGRSVPAGAVAGSKKASWPEVVGWPAHDAALQISKDRPDVSISLYIGTGPWPPGPHPWRVVVVSDAATGVVVQTPVVG